MNFIIKHQMTILSVIASLLLSVGAFFWGNKAGETSGKETGQAKGKESVCQDLKDKIAEIQDPKPTINLAICQPKLRANELPKRDN